VAGKKNEASADKYWDRRHSRFQNAVSRNQVQVAVCFIAMELLGNVDNGTKLQQGFKFKISVETQLLVLCNRSVLGV
jgi:hypothetical protein